MGSGYRVFTAGEVLTASNVQNYLQDQAVMVFGGTAARSSAIGTANFEEGMLTYLTDVDKLQVYTGAAFADVYPAAATNQGLTLISTTSFSGVSSFSLAADTFTTTYENYKVLITLSGTSNDADIFLRLRAAGSDNSTSNYKYGIMAYRSNNTANNYGFAGVSNISFGQTESAFSASANFYYDIDISQPKLAVNTKVLSKGQDTDGSSNYVTRQAGGLFNATTQFDSASFILSAGTMSGKYSVYGYNL